MIKSASASGFNGQKPGHYYEAINGGLNGARDSHRLRQGFSPCPIASVKLIANMANDSRLSEQLLLSSHCSSGGQNFSSTLHITFLLLSQKREGRENMRAFSELFPPLLCVKKE